MTKRGRRERGRERERDGQFFKRLSAGVDDKIIKIDLRVRLFGFSTLALSQWR